MILCLNWQEWRHNLFYELRLCVSVDCENQAEKSFIVALWKVKFEKLIWELTLYRFHQEMVSRVIIVKRLEDHWLNYDMGMKTSNEKLHLAAHVIDFLQFTRTS